MNKNISPEIVATQDDDMRSEYDFTGGIRGKHYQALREEGYIMRIYEEDGTITERRIVGARTVTLEPDVYEYFPDSEAVNHALRMLISLVPERRKITATTTQRAKSQRKSPTKQA